MKKYLEDTWKKHKRVGRKLIAAKLKNDAIGFNILEADVGNAMINVLDGDKI